MSVKKKSKDYHFSGKFGMDYLNDSVMSRAPNENNNSYQLVFHASSAPQHAGEVQGRYLNISEYIEGSLVLQQREKVLYHFQAWWQVGFRHREDTLFVRLVCCRILVEI